MILDSDSGSQGVKGSAFRVPEGQGVGLVGPNGLKGDVRGVGVGDIIEKLLTADIWAFFSSYRQLINIEKIHLGIIIIEKCASNFI